MSLRIPRPDEYQEQILFTAGEISERLRELGQEISQAYPKGLVLLANQRASAVFLTDLMRTLSVPVDYDFLELGRVSLDDEAPLLFLKQVATVNITGQDVLLLTDIVRSAFSVHFLLEQLSAKEPKSLEICSLLYNPIQQLLPIPIKYKGFETTHHSVCGYGMAYRGDGRQYPDIVKLLAENAED